MSLYRLSMSKLTDEEKKELFKTKYITKLTPGEKGDICNEDGCLPCPRCGGYPEIKDFPEVPSAAFFHLCKSDDEWMVKTESRLWKDKETAVKEWNRRV